MKYVPDLIPKDKRVLPDYFKNNPFKYTKGNTALNVLGYIAGSIFILMAFASINYILLALLYGVIGFVLLPVGHRFLENIFSFKLTTRIKAIFCSSLFVISLPVHAHYKGIDIIEAKRVQVKEAEIAKANVESKRKDAIRIDSFNIYYNKALSFEKENKADDAEKMLNTANLFAVSDSEKGLLETERKNLSKIKTLLLVKNSKYKEALPALSSLLQANPEDVDLLCNRAKCLHKVGRTQEAVNDLKTAINYGSAEAENLHEKINPIRKRVAYYTTLCCDGTTSSATGRGACSWHGGVCDWNHPIYEEYRKYE
ncbi:hypothetical protein CAP35_04765 [Chitinophagaceae bacterium IBVUCB1]|nr:hypothetical protein CAP35_04765 [Chitinophagaceae bacterium IBVUCB1]